MTRLREAVPNFLLVPATPRALRGWNGEEEEVVLQEEAQDPAVEESRKEEVMAEEVLEEEELTRQERKNQKAWERKHGALESGLEDLREESRMVLGGDAAV